MANATETTLSQVEENVSSREAIVFSGESRNMAIGFAMLAAGIAAFVADLTKRVADSQRQPTRPQSGIRGVEIDAHEAPAASRAERPSSEHRAHGQAVEVGRRHPELELELARLADMPARSCHGFVTISAASDGIGSSPGHVIGEGPDVRNATRPAACAISRRRSQAGDDR